MTNDVEVKDYPDMTNEEVLEELATYFDSKDDVEMALYQEIGIRLGISGIFGLRHEGRLAGADRLRRYRELWNGQPEAQD
jgi:hypothetical protein